MTTRQRKPKDTRHAELLERLPKWYSPGERRELEPLLNRAKRAGWSRWIRTRADAQAVLEGCYWSRGHAHRVVDFCELGIIQVNGRFKGKPFKVLPYQWDGVIGPLFGWLKPDGFRRHRKGYITVAKKNGKSGLCAAMQLYCLAGDGEYGANNYCAANDKTQAKNVFDEAVKYARESPEIDCRVRISDTISKIRCDKYQSKLTVISKEGATNAEGFDAHLLLFDELHMAKGAALWDVVELAGKARPNSICPLVITTAGSDLNSICGIQYKYAKAILSGENDDTTYLACVHEAPDAECDVLDPAAWAAANPALGVILSAEDMKAEAKQAIAQGRTANFRRRALNQWVADDDSWSAAKLWPAAVASEVFSA